MSKATVIQRPTPIGAPTSAPEKEPWTEQAASFVGFFIYLLILKTFFLPLFIIPTGSMAETLYGQHALHTCPNCGTEYAVGWPPPEMLPPGHWSPIIQCPNCRWREYYGDPRLLGPQRPAPDSIMSAPLRPAAGDRIFVHGWNYGHPFAGLDDFGPARWDVVVFKVPTDGDTNYIKRLIGLPGEKIELIDGDLFVNDVITGKPADAQRSLWFPYYDHDFPPTQEARAAAYFPRWVALDDSGAWSDLDRRVIRFGSDTSTPARIQFSTDARNGRNPGLVQDIYGYNEPPGRGFADRMVSDVRLSAEVQFERLPEKTGFLEFSTTKGPHRFFALVEAPGTVRLQHQATPDAPREDWGQAYALPTTSGPVKVALCHLDGSVSIEINGQPVIRTTREQYELSPAQAATYATARTPPTLQIAAQGAQFTLRHLLIERDVYYTSEAHYGTHATQGHPMQLGPNDYFVLGDNSPNSQDARSAFSRPGADPVGPHLKARAAAGEFQPGTVPGDQLIGRAFFVYWPGFQPLAGVPFNILPDLGRARWIR